MLSKVKIMFGVDLKLNDYQFLKDKGICVKCRKAKADYGYVSCLQCRMDEREYKKMYYHNKMTDEQKKEIVRLHTGDPSIYGAVREQMERQYYAVMGV